MRETQAQNIHQETLTLFQLHRQVVLLDIADPVLTSRLISMGILPGMKMSLVRSTLRGNTYIVLAGKHYFAMRKNEVNALRVKPVTEA